VDHARLAVDGSRNAWQGRGKSIALDACNYRADAKQPGWLAPAGNDRVTFLLQGRTMSKRHAQKRVSQAARRKKLLTERRKVAMAESRMPIHSCQTSEALRPRSAKATWFLPARRRTEERPWPSSCSMPIASA
jgi:hypothetical protein